ncbi:MAG: hypothetical protein KKB95_23260 [Gammaproteobacteria bacterium]|jgi:hypothetical protein|nr:hypothetical protein [Gammaproteobacteria bacterium]MBU0829288.1 hypothetical protein [Gammaproteobacteria bacterium]MBU0892792.1 hypothetical protein [Gammaproteobacteria bacterium]MBU1354795.1 hypothetical protein [Gammaproteobacteria bacterium]MBU1506658.1 hypothetical protein [Gammaproteobacteria bacterium]
MNTALVLAAAGLAIVGAVHSVMGEILVFRTLRTRGVVPTGGYPVLREHQVRILWGTWHLVTLLGWALSALLWRLASVPVETDLVAWMADLAGAATLASGLLVFYATDGRHPAWVALLVIATLVWWR